MPSITIKRGVFNDVYLPYITDEKHKYQIFYGGSSSGKSFFLAARCVLDCLNGRNYLVVRKVARTLRQSCWNEITKAITRMKLTDYFVINKSEMTITGRYNGAQILFAGLDDVEKVKSITPAKGALTDIWIEEATEAAYDDYKQLTHRLRGRTRHKKRITLSFNPVYQQHWIFKEFFWIWDDGKQHAENEHLSILKTTYRDNRFLTEDDRLVFELNTDPYFREVYANGNWGVLGDVIFRNWECRDLTEEAKAWPQRIYGLDFGFASDPCGAVDVAFDRKKKTVYIFNELCERGLTNTMLAERLQAFCGHRPIVCDSAEPKSIQELKNEGIYALAAKKGQDSVVHGVQWLQGCHIVIDTKCRALKEELTLYQWKQDKDGNTLPVPEDRNNHLIDALRYALEDESSQRIARTGSKAELGL